MKVNKNDLITAIEKVKSGLSRTLLNFTGSHIITSSDIIFAIIPFDLKEVGPFSVDAKGFYNIISGISEEEIELKLKQESLSITSSKTRAKIRISIKNENDLKNIQKIIKNDSWDKLPKTFMKYLSICSISTLESNLTSNSILKNILIRENLMASSDSFRISRCFLRRKIKLPKKEILLPSDTISKILNKSFDYYSFSNPFFLLKDESDLVYGIRIEEGKYKEFEDHFDLDGIEIDFPSDLYNIISSSSKFLRDTNDEISTEHEVIKITLKRNILMTKVKRDIGWIEKKLPIKYMGKSFSFLTNPKLLEELSQDMTKMIISKEKALFKTDDFEILIVLPYKDEKDGNENEV
jgi:DNA polymerase III sliding clamp (beta) subunit (PCNA family)